MLVSKRVKCALLVLQLFLFGRDLRLQLLDLLLETLDFGRIGSTTSPAPLHRETHGLVGCLDLGAHLFKCIRFRQLYFLLELDFVANEQFACPQ